MAVGNAVSVTNGVTSVGGIEIQAHAFCDSSLIGNQCISVILPIFTGRSAAISSYHTNILFILSTDNAG